MYRQTSQKLEVIIRKESSGGVNGAKEKDVDTVSANDTEATSQGNEKSNVSQSKSFVKTNVTHALAIVKQATTRVARIYVNQLSNRNGDTALQEIVGRQLEIVDDFGNFIHGAAMGAVYGSAGGVPGAILGAAFGAVSSAIATGGKYIERSLDFEYTVFKENNAIEYNRAKAELNLTSGRLR